MKTLRKCRLKMLYICFIISFNSIFLCSCLKSDSGMNETAQEEYVFAELFCDVEFWKAPVWDTTEGTIMNRISKETGLALDVEVTLQDTGTQMSLMLLNDTLPDIISVVDTTVIHQLVSSGKVWDMEEFLRIYKPDSHLLNSFPEDVLNELKKRDGGWYAFPSHIESEDCRELWPLRWNCHESYTYYGSNSAIIWNRRLLDQMGLSVDDLQTESQVLAALKKGMDMKISVDGKTMIPLLLDGADYDQAAIEFMMHSFGAEYVDENGNYKDIYLQPETKDALSFYNQLVRSSCIDIGQFHYDNSYVKELIASGRVLCFIGNIANIAYKPDEWVSSGPVFADSGKIPVYGTNTRATCGWISTFIAKDCDHPEQIAEFIDYMTSEEGYRLWRFGLEGAHYDLDEDGCVIMTEKGKLALTDYTKSGIGAWWMFENTAHYRSLMPNIMDNTLEAYDLENATKYGSHEAVARYDASLLNVPAAFYDENQTLQMISIETTNWKNEQVLKILLAEDDSCFENAYAALLVGLKERGIDTLDKALDDNYKKNCKEYDAFILKHNKITVDGE